MCLLQIQRASEDDYWMNSWVKKAEAIPSLERKGFSPLVAWLGEEEGKPQPHSHPHYPPTHSCQEGSRPRAFALAVLPPWKVFPTDTPWLPPFFPPFPSLGSNRTFSEWSSLPVPFNMASAVLLHHLFSCSVVSNSLWPHELQHASPPCPSLSPRVFSNSCPLSWWCHPPISSSRLQFFRASGSFPMSQLFASGGQSTGASASVLPVHIQDWLPFGLTCLISLLSKGLWSLLQHHSSKESILQCSAFFMVQLSHPYTTAGKTIAASSMAQACNARGPRSISGSGRSLGERNESPV